MQRSGNINELIDYKLPSGIYRRFLLLTSAQEFARASPESLLLRFHQGGFREPIFWCGAADFLPYLVKELGVDHPIYSLYGTLHVLAPTEENIQALARYYFAEIVKVHSGPYILGGYCEAALISYEIAQLMQQHGFIVKLLFLFERDLTESNFYLKLARRVFLAVETAVRRWDLLWVDPKACIRITLLNKWQQLFVSPWLNFKRKLGLAPPKAGEQRTYQLRPYLGRVFLLYINFGMLGYFQLPFFRRYWQKLILGPLNIQFMTGVAHGNPEWMKVAKIFSAKLKNQD